MPQGATDSGVHSLGQVANFKTNSNLEIEKIPYAINSKLKKSIRIKKAEEVDEKFHARYNCKKKRYRYTINNSEQGSAIYMKFRISCSKKIKHKQNEKCNKIYRR